MEFKPAMPEKIAMGKTQIVPGGLKHVQTVDASGYLWTITVTASEETGDIHVDATFTPANRETTLSRISAAVEGQALWLIERGIGEG